MRALHSRQPERDLYWKQATEAIEHCRQLRLGPVDMILLQTQEALTLLQQAEWNRREAEVEATKDDDWEEARSTMREAIRRLSTVQQQLVKVRAGLEPGVSDVQLAELARNIQLQLARGYRNQAINYAQQPTDRVNALTLALQQLQNLSSSTSIDDVVWESRLEQIRCYRLLREHDRARSLISDATDLPDRWLGALAAEGIRLALDLGQPERALRLVENSRGSVDDPYFELARIETLVVLAEQANQREPNSDEVRRLRKQGLDRATTLTDRHGTYWGLRGEMLIARLAEAQQPTSDSDLLATAASTLLKRGLPDDAIAMFTRVLSRQKVEVTLGSLLNTVCRPRR